GGVIVAEQVALALGRPLDVLVVRKLGVPGHEELAMGAIASGGILILDEQLIDRLDIPARLVDQAAAAETKELMRREREYRANGPPLAVAGKTVIVIDDGLATGSSMRAAIAALRRRKVGRLVVGVPIA